MADLSDDIATQAVGPSSASVDGRSATARPVADLIAAQQFLDAKAAVAKRRRGVTLTKLVAPGALDDCGRAGTPPFNGGV